MDDYSARGNAFFSQIDLIDKDGQFRADERTVEMYKSMSAEQFTLLSGQIFEFYFTDEINVKFRKMLTISFATDLM